MKTEYPGDKSCLQRNSAEREEYAGARSIDNRETEWADGAAKAKLRKLTSRSQGRNVRVVLKNVKVYIRGWLATSELQA